MKMPQIPSKTVKTLLLAAMLAPFAWAEDTDGPEPVWQDAVMVRQGEQEYELLTPREAEDLRKKRQEKETASKQEPDPGWIGDCYYYADGGYYHKDGVYWRADMKTHYVYAEKCWHLPNGGVLTETGVYYPPIAAPDGLLGIPWRLAAVVTALIAGPPHPPGNPPQKPTRVVIEVRSSSDR